MARCKALFYARKRFNDYGTAETDLVALFTSSVHMGGKEQGVNETMCEHCEKVNEVLTELTGNKVASVIMRRVGARLHPLHAEAPPTLVVVTA